MRTTREIIAQVDIYHHPLSDQQPERCDLMSSVNDVVTIGDLHGNAIKLLYFLVRENCFSIAEKDYDELVSIYRKKLTTLAVTDLERFEEIVNNMIRQADAPALRFIGDILADRGKNDYFTLLLFRKMGLSNINYEILLSNHDAIFIEIFNKDLLLNDPKLQIKTIISKHQQDNSLQGLVYLLKNMRIDSRDIDDIMTNHFLNHIKILGYDIDNSSSVPEIMLFTHAPTNLGIIERLQQQFDILPLDESLVFTSIDEVVSHIDLVNDAFVERLALGTLDTHEPVMPDDKTLRGDTIYGLDKKLRLVNIPLAVYEAIWGREEWYNMGSGIEREANFYFKDELVFKAKYGNGHDGMAAFREDQGGFVVNLNSMLGMVVGGDENNVGEYIVLTSMPVVLAAELGEKEDTDITDAIMADVPNEMGLFGKKRKLDEADLQDQDTPDPQDNSPEPKTKRHKKGKK